MTYNFPTHTSGDTFMGVEFTVSNASGEIDLTGVSIVLKTLSNIELSTQNGGIVITDAIGGVFQVKEQVISWPPKKYTYTLKVTYPSGKIRTYLTGNWQIS